MNNDTQHASKHKYIPRFIGRRLSIRYIRSWIVAILIVFVIGWLGVQSYRIPTNSMLPLIHGDIRPLYGDRVLANKAAYSWRIPFTDVQLLRLGTPERWEVVVFLGPTLDGGNEVMVKRVVGLPGEQVRLIDNQIHINGVIVEPPPDIAELLHYTKGLVPSRVEMGQTFVRMAKTGHLSPALNPEHGPVQVLTQDLLTHGEHVAHIDPTSMSEEEAEEVLRVLERESVAVLDSLLRWADYLTPPRYGLEEEEASTIIPPDCYYLLGDNGAASVDSRHFGWIPHRRLLGRVFCIYWPPHHIRDISGFSRTWSGLAILLGVLCSPVLWKIVQRIRRIRVKHRRNDTLKNGQVSS